MYKIANYDDLYRPYDKAGRELVYATWVKLPAKPKGDGLQTLLEKKRGLEVFGIWCLLLEKTTNEKKAKNRGLLLNHQEQPATIPEIAKGISLGNKARLVEYALTALVEMGWVKNDGQCEHDEDTVSTEVRKSPEQSSVEKSSVEKSKYMDCVLLTPEQYQKLIDQFGEKATKEKIEALNNYIESKGRKYKSHYHTILNWSRKDPPSGETIDQRLDRLLPAKEDKRG